MSELKYNTILPEQIFQVHLVLTLQTKEYFMFYKQKHNNKLVLLVNVYTILLLQANNPAPKTTSTVATTRADDQARLPIARSRAA